MGDSYFSFTGFSIKHLIKLGDYYCFDNPGAMHSLLKERFHELTENEFEYFFHSLYSVYSLPNIVLPIIGGICIYKYGYRVMFLVFGFFILLGQLIFSLGCSTKSVSLMLAGRVVFGLGGESLNSTQYSIIIEWFSKSEVGLSLGICLSFARFANVLNDVISPRIATVRYNIYI
jgi:MFS family permease